MDVRCYTILDNFFIKNMLISHINVCDGTNGIDVATTSLK